VRAADSTPFTVREIFQEIQTDLYEVNLKWITQDDIFAALQEAYNKIVALLCPIEKATFIPQINSPYYDFAKQIPDWMYLAGIYNPSTLLWLKGVSYRMMKAEFETYLAVGNPEFYNVADFRRILIWPFNPSASGALFVVYKAKAPAIYIPGPAYNGDGYYNWDAVPLLPYSVAKPLLEYFTVADLLEQSREFTKAGIWWDKLLKPPLQYGTSILDQARKEISDLARADRENVLEPYRWIFHGGASGNVTWINDETPDGVIDGTNTQFTLAKAPNPSSSLILTKNGQILYADTGYTINGSTISIQTGYIPQPATSEDLLGDQIRAWYQIN
jgi:hypothetical protein